MTIEVFTSSATALKLLIAAAIFALLIASLFLTAPVAMRFSQAGRFLELCSLIAAVWGTYAFAWFRLLEPSRPTNLAVLYEVPEAMVVATLPLAAIAIVWMRQEQTTPNFLPYLDASRLLKVFFPAIVSALREEFMFRLVLFSVLMWFIKRPRTCVVLVSLIFAWYHTDAHGDWLRLTSLFFASAWLTFLFFRTHSYAVVVFAHATHNYILWTAFAPNNGLQIVPSSEADATWPTLLCTLMLYCAHMYIVECRCRRREAVENVTRTTPVVGMELEPTRF